MTYRFVTSMSQAGYNQYGKAFLDSFLENCPYPLTVYTEDPLEDERFPVKSLKFDEEWKAFYARCDDPSDYRWQAGRFSKKIFAVTDYRLRLSDWLIWIDADVVIEKPITDDFLKVACPDDRTGSYLGREDWHHSECGWVAYNLSRDGGSFLDAFRHCYTSGAIFRHLEWHDSYIFDRIRESGTYKWFNLSSGVPGMHVWDGCILGQCMKHLKGPLRKKGATAEVPESYWSEHEKRTSR
jgi:hypothetical protein